MLGLGTLGGVPSANRLFGKAQIRCDYIKWSEPSANRSSQAPQMGRPQISKNTEDDSAAIAIAQSGIYRIDFVHFISEALRSASDVVMLQLDGEPVFSTLAPSKGK